MDVILGLDQAADAKLVMSVLIRGVLEGNDALVSRMFSKQVQTVADKVFGKEALRHRAALREDVRLLPALVVGPGG